ncbi:hypothetical protein I4905_06325 [Proteus mirabilis]|uniref:Uncharacterized protein n=1 Tax=Proteus mirabilis TaxID=584 RepID=A0AAJ0YCJ3_PROMI|nr:hypothetical protein AM402_10715 [Proteus mirabilis]NBM27996.1 hypothetical protein [Proteus sp. G4417]NBM36508.1 hypothetical protein [Proteus sp. G4419]NBN31852.1 hypothetical protein [Proteus sp. G4412]EJD6314407.1 hypothetical protein [Proteus mirabilis]
MISDAGAFMKQIIIIAGGIISLTIMIAIFVAILVVSVFKEDTVAAWNNSRNVIENSSIQINDMFSFVKGKRDDVMARYQSLENSESCNQLVSKLDSVEKALAEGSLLLPRSSIEQIFAIKNSLNDSSSPAQSFACEQAIQFIDRINP